MQICCYFYVWPTATCVGKAATVATQANEQQKAKKEKQSLLQTHKHTHIDKNNFPLVWTHVVSRERLNFYLEDKRSAVSTRLWTNLFVCVWVCESK